MMKRKQFLQARMGEAWMMHVDHFTAMMDQMAAGDSVGVQVNGEYVHPQVQVVGAVAYVPVRGMLLKGVSLFDAFFFGDYDVDLLEKQVQLIADDVNIKHVVFDVDSPGGVALGIGAVAQAIADLPKSGKNTYCFSSGMVCSAAYYLMAGCQQLIGTEDSVWGSISTYSAGVDSSKAWAMAGRELKLYRTGELKAVGLPGKPWTDEEMAAIKERVDGIDGLFKGFVKANRPGLADEAMNGNHWYARFAPKGLLDGFAPSAAAVVEYLLKL